MEVMIIIYLVIVLDTAYGNTIHQSSRRCTNSHISKTVKIHQAIFHKNYSKGGLPLWLIFEESSRK